MSLTDKIRITNEDNMALMARYPNKHFDLAIVDPPYGIGDTFIGFSSGAKKGALKRVHKQMEWDDTTPTQEYFCELRRVSQKQIVWGANYFNSFGSDGGALVWFKNRGGDTLSQCEIASVSGQKKVDYVAIQILTGFVSNENRIHPTQKPVALYKWLLKNYATPDMRILDTHLGSGSIAIACHEFGCDLTACELDPDYYRDAMKRIQNHINQTNLFL
jgi:site-specific DNA-methyltransferase (adenine-specific)